VERALEAELTAHLGYAPHARQGSASDHARTGQGKQTVHLETGEWALEVPRDRHGSFEPQLGKKRQRRLAGFDAKGLALYARGVSTRAMQAHLEEFYEVAGSPTLLSKSTDAVLDDVHAWPARPRAAVSPSLYCEALLVTARQEGPGQMKAVYLALGIPLAGEKDLLGLWRSESEGAPLWLSVFHARQSRGVEDCCIAGGDGLKGRPEALEAVVPQTQGQWCLVHKVRNSLRYVPWKERRAVAAALRAIYGAATLPAAEQARERFAVRWDAQEPALSPSWLTDWDRLPGLFDYPPAIRRAIYTTNAIASLPYALRKVRKGRGACPNDAAMVKLFYRGLQHVAKQWTQPIPEWKAALNQCVMLFGERVPM
jgi:transposase-like protein